MLYEGKKIDVLLLCTPCFEGGKLPQLFAKKMDNVFLRFVNSKPSVETERMNWTNFQVSDIWEHENTKKNVPVNTKQGPIHMAVLRFSGLVSTYENIYFHVLYAWQGVPCLITHLRGHDADFLQLTYVKKCWEIRRIKNRQSMCLIFSFISRVTWIFVDKCYMKIMENLKIILIWL